MATIPVVTRQIREQVDQSLRLDPGSAARQFNIDVTRSSDSTARGLQNLSEGIMSLATERENTDITARANGFTEDLQRYLYDPDVGVLMTTPEELSNGLTETTDAYVKKTRDAYGKGLSKSAQARYQAATNGSALGANQSAMKHETVELGKYGERQSKLAVTNAAIAISNAPFDMDVFASAMDPVYNDIAIRTKDMPAEYRDKEAEVRSKQVTAEAVKMLWTKAPLSAREFLQSHKDEFTENEYNILLSDTNTAVVPAEAEAWSDALVAEKGWRKSPDAAEKYIKENVSPDNQDTYRKVAAEVINREYGVHQRRANEITNNAIEAINTGRYGTAKKAVDIAVKELTSMEEAGAARALMNTLKGAFPPAPSAPGPSDMQKNEAKAWVIRMLRGAAAEGNAITDWESLYSAFYEKEGRWAGKLNPVYSGVLTSALSSFKSERSKGGSGGGLFQQGAFAPETKLILNSAIKNTEQRELFQDKLEKEYDVMVSKGTVFDNEAKKDYARKRILEEKPVMQKKAGIFGIGSSENVIYVNANTIAEYEAYSGTKYGELGSGGAGVFTPVGGGDPEYYAPNVQRPGKPAFSPSTVFEPPTSKTSVSAIAKSNRAKATTTTLSDLNKQREKDIKTVRDLTAR